MTDETITDDRVLTRHDMAKPGALQTFRERGQIGNTEIAMGTHRGGARFENMMQVMEFAKLMAMSDVAVPTFLRGNPGACLRIAIQADEWGFSPFAVADKSYMVTGKGGETKIAYESQLVHAIIERRAPLEGRLRMSFEGEGQTRACVVTGRLIGEADPFIWKGPEIQNIKVKNSPEWSANPDKQLWYHASRDWARIYCPDVLMGVYTRDELEGTELGPQRARDVSDLASRLPAQASGGYDAQGIARTLAAASGGSEETADTTERPQEERASEAPSEQQEQTDPVTGEVTNAEPTTKAEYVAYANRWIDAEGDKDNAEARWDGERELRGKCSVSVTDRKKLEKKINEKFANG